ncbi:MAG: glycosyltransferase [Acidobacteria bacterium]|nr:glycosyltransferase [Acidobacteriota bacterium]
MRQRVKLAFATGSDDLIPSLIDELRKIEPDLPLWLVSEFPPPEPVDKWIRWYPAKDFASNRARVLFETGACEVAYAAILVQPRMPYWKMRAMAAMQWPWRLIVYNENLGHFMLRPRSLPVILRHFLWRTGNFIRWETRPGGTLYTWVWRLFHPRAFRRPIAYWLARRDSNRLPVRRVPPITTLPNGVAVVIPSRNGRELLSRLFESLLPENADQIIVVDNGSDDGTAAWLARHHPTIEVEVSREPLSFAAAVNRGIARVSVGKVCLLNNDMIVEPGFLDALRTSFDRVPDLFAATAQILFPPGVRREETGKAMFHPSSNEQFPLWCETPLAGEDGTWVLYGSGGCTLYDTGKLRALGCLDERYTPAYVEDLDIGWRAWAAGWPTVFAAGARVEHRHRSTTSRYYSPFELECAVERNFLKFAASSGSDRLWHFALDRLNTLAAKQEPVRSAELALFDAWRHRRAPNAGDAALDLCNGAIAVFPGRKATEGRRRIAVAAPYLPFPLSHGGAVRMFNLMREAAKEFDQILIVFVDELQPPAPELLELCAEIVLVRRDGTHLLPASPRPDVVEEHDRPEFRAALQWTIKKWNPSIVQLEFTQMGLYAPDCRPAKTILVEHDITFDLYAQLLADKIDYDTREQHARWEVFERQLWNRVDSVVVMSAKDRATVGMAKAVTIRNGVDLARFVPGGTAPDPNTLLFIGSFAHLPNVMALDFFLREVWPRLHGALLHIIAGQRHEYFLERHAGRVRLDLSVPGVRVDGFVSDVRQAYEEAAIVIAPLVASAGTNIKIMEAMAMKKAIVSTPAGINGLDLTGGHDVIVTRTGPEMAAAIQDLMAGVERRQSIERHARETVEREFGWERIGRVQADLYRSL